MSRIGDADWVRIDEADLRPGMTVRGRAGAAKTVAVILVRRVKSIGHQRSVYRGRCTATWAWITSALPDNPTCWCKVYGQGGHIERLRDLDDAEEEGRRIACDIDDRKRAGQQQHEQSRRVLSRRNDRE